ncbi:MAG: DUF411 domain-containing protein [Silicimonas sp.]|nr:DUF411 domain-containing protein [Silicimonas sp.]
MSKHKPRRTSRKTAPWLWVGLVGVLAAVGATAYWLSPRNQVIDADAEVVVYKTPSCGCCIKWVDHLEDHGMSVSVVNVQTTRGAQSKLGVPPEFASCHTAKVGDYWVEGHVPADLIKQLMAEKPADVVGLTVPGMPIGSPGMEGPNPQEYEILAVAADGSTRVYDSRQGHSKPQPPGEDVDD